MATTENVRIDENAKGDKWSIGHRVITSREAKPRRLL